MPDQEELEAIAGEDQQTAACFRLFMMFGVFFVVQNGW